MDWFIIWLFAEYGLVLFVVGLAVLLFFAFLLYNKKRKS